MVVGVLKDSGFFDCVARRCASYFAQDDGFWVGVRDSGS